MYPYIRKQLTLIMYLSCNSNRFNNFNKEYLIFTIFVMYAVYTPIFVITGSFAIHSISYIYN